ncbi:MAG: YhcH/YjgK/YiaL family protein [Anaerolineae bacterium]|nr:YhcH/YjgK/YiaL family protein [Anaerolineae bacterium]
MPLSAGSFMLLWPDEAHMPGLAVDDPVPIRKVVVKIAV